MIVSQNFRTPGENLNGDDMRYMRADNHELVRVIRTSNLLAKVSCLVGFSPGFDKINFILPDYDADLEVSDTCITLLLYRYRACKSPTATSMSRRQII